MKHAAGKTDTIEDAILPYIMANDAKFVDGKVVGDPTEGALLILGHKAGLDVGQTQEELPRLATLPFDPTYKLMATFHEAKDSSGKSVVRCYVKGAAPAVTERASTSALSNGASLPWDADLKRRSDENSRANGKDGATRYGRRGPRPGPRPNSTLLVTCWTTSATCS